MKKDKAKYSAYKARKAAEKRRQRQKKKLETQAKDAKLKELANSVKERDKQMKVSMNEKSCETKAREKLETKLQDALERENQLKAKYRAMDRMLRDMIFSHEQVVAWKASGRGQIALKGCTLPFPQIG